MKIRQTPISLMALLALLCPISIFVACFFGAYNATSDQVLSAFTSFLNGQLKSSDPASFIVINLRLSRVCLAYLVGASLAVSGAVYQGILRNPLADPFTLGVSSGAAFGASLAIFLGSSSIGLILSNYLGSMLLPISALSGAMLALVAVLFVGRVGGSLRRETMVLAGIVVATFLSALISLLKSLDEDSVSSIVFWIMGSFQGRGFEHLFIFIPYFLVGMGLIAFFSKELDILSLGENQAKQLGMNVNRSRTALLIGAGLVTGVSVSVSGIIGFVGLIVPHLVRKFVGAEHKYVLICSALLGGVLLVWSDVLARVILDSGQELPVGVVTALLGGPFFCIVLRHKMEKGHL